MAEIVPDWFVPEDVVWQGEGHKDALRKKVATGVTHILREVNVRPPGPQVSPECYSAAMLRDLSALADQEFLLLKTFGIVVPPVKWHVCDRDGRAALVARVAVIEGHDLIDELHTPAFKEKDRAIEKAVRSYGQSSAPGARLLDVNTSQFVEGYIRPIPAPAQQYMIDIEPRFH